MVKLKVIKGGSNAPLYTGSAAVFPYNKKLAKAHSHVDRFEAPYFNYRTIGKDSSEPRIMLPRAKFPLGAEDQRIDGEEVICGLVDGVEPRNDEQWRVVQELESKLATKTGIIVNASTGFGKTFIGCCQIALVERTTLVLVTKSDLEDQWRDSFKKFLGLGDDEIGLLKGDICDVAGKKVVIGYVQSVMKWNRYSSWVYKYFGNVIFDEVHLLAADKFVNCCWQLPAKYRLGLSATLDRSDGKDHVFKDHIGRNIIQAELLPMQFNVSVVRTQVHAPKSVYYKAGRTMQLNNFLGQHKPRQNLITQKIVKAYEGGRNVVCFADTKDHLSHAFDCLVDAGVKIRDIGFYVGLPSGAKQADKDNLKIEAHKKIVLATYKMTQYGTDFPHWDTAVLMTPRSDVRQIVGRVLREKEGKKIPLVFDFVDKIPLLEKYYRKRRHWYKSEALKIVGD
jgi:superfamily II DNA or RNA helicase